MIPISNIAELKRIMAMLRIAAILRIACRNLARHRVKTILTCIAIMVSVAMYIFVDGWLVGMNIESKRNIVNYEMGAAKLQERAYLDLLDEKPMYENFAGWETYAAALDAAGYDSAPRFVFSGTLFSETGSAPIELNAIDPEADAALLRYADWVEQGRFIKSGAFEIVLGAETAKKLHVGGPDDNNDVRISTVIDIKDEGGLIRHVYQIIDAVVVGTINSPNPKNNNNCAWLPLDVLQDDAGMMLNGHITELLIRAKKAKQPRLHDSALPGPFESPQTITANIAESVTLPPELGIFGWETYSVDYLNASAGDNWTSRIMVIILFILSFLGIANTMLLAILERTKEIGMMRAQGMTDGQLVFTYMLEAGMVGFFGAALGVIIGCLINIPMVKYGIDFSQMMGSLNGNMGYRVNGVFRSAWNVPVIICTGIIAVLLSSLTAFLPTRRTLKMPITESLRFE
ncbi:ABC transporter permease [Spirochaetia bacterium]|nr:ABC transporter permease [Spirochaetia bacterium]